MCGRRNLWNKYIIMTAADGGRCAGIRRRYHAGGDDETILECRMGGVKGASGSGCSADD